MPVKKQTKKNPEVLGEKTKQKKVSKGVEKEHKISAPKKAEKKIIESSTPKKVSKKKKDIPVVTQEELGFYKKKFLSILEEMLKDSRGIGHLLFNGLFRLPMNKRLYEFTDEELVKAFSQQLKIMQNQKERESGDAKKNLFLKRVVEC